MSRFSTSVRIFASACAGCGRITYLRYLAFDTVGTVVYTTVCVLVGYWIGERAVVFFTTDRRRWLFLGVVVFTAATLIAYRLWRRFRYGGAGASGLRKVLAGAKAERGRADFTVLRRVHQFERNQSGDFPRARPYLAVIV